MKTFLRNMRAFWFALLPLAGCSTFEGRTGVQREVFGTLPDGRVVNRYILRNASGNEVHLTDFGATILRILVPDKNGKKEDVVLGYATLEEYTNDSATMGAIAGRFANRIAGGLFSLDGVPVQVSVNTPPNTLHGGFEGFNSKLWTTEINSSKNISSVLFSLVSPDGEEGFPGNLTVKVRFTWTDNNSLEIEYEAITDKTTVVNLTSHPYFNLSGNAHEGITNHTLQIRADAFIPVDEFMIPLPERRLVSGTPFDFNLPTLIQDQLVKGDTQIVRAFGFDHSFVLNGSGFHEAAALVHKTSGRKLIVKTDQPAIQLYTGNFLGGKRINKDGQALENRMGVCLESQHFPDSPNRPDFPTTTLRPGEVFKSKTEYLFTIDQ